jgi:4-carboxymuconolactone decarboxylase
VDPSPSPPRPLDDLLRAAACAARGDRAGLAAAAARALAADPGRGRARLREALLQGVPFAGFPRTIVALREVAAALGPPGTAPPEPPPEAGAATFGRVYGEGAAAVRAGLAALDPALERWTIGFAYRQVLAREGALDLRERELLAVAVLAALGGLDEPLRGHVRGALRAGATADEVARARALGTA